VSVNGKSVDADVANGWLVIERRWVPGDVVLLELPMPIERISMPAAFEDYDGLVAVRRGPVVYCVEEEDSSAAVALLALPDDARFVVNQPSHRLAGAATLSTALPTHNYWDARDEPGPVTFVPYGVWCNRNPGPMRIWLPRRQLSLEDVLAQRHPANPGAG
jgi:hypothetical protein